MPLELIDTHCHLDYEPLASSIDAVLSRARAAGLQCCVTIGTTVETSRQCVALTQRHPIVRAAVGVHPTETGALTDEEFGQIEALTREAGVVAIGEVGLDYYHKTVVPDVQVVWFRRFLQLARSQRLPIAIHCRNAYPELLDAIRAETSGPVRGLMHCASGPTEFIQGALGLGFHISFAGNVTFPKADALRALVPLVPDDRVLIETDAPFLAPQPVRGKPNEPAYVAHTAEVVAQLRGVSAEALGQLTSRNARRLFELPDVL